MRKIINNLSVIIFILGIIIMISPWILSVDEMQFLVIAGFLTAMFGLIVDFKYVEDKSNDIIDDIKEEL